MFEFTQIGWFNPGDKRFCYTDEKEYDQKRKQKYYDNYTHPVFAIDSKTAKGLSVQLNARYSDRGPKHEVMKNPGEEGG